MSTPAASDPPQPRDIALEQSTPEQAADLEAQSDPAPDTGSGGTDAESGAERDDA